MPYIPVLYRFARCIYIMDFHSAWTYTNRLMCLICVMILMKQSLGADKIISPLVKNLFVWVQNTQPCDVVTEFSFSTLRVTLSFKDLKIFAISYISGRNCEQHGKGCYTKIRATFIDSLSCSWVQPGPTHVTGN